MGRDLANWNLGMADAESGSLAAPGKSRDYYDGYEYACAVNYEYIAAAPAFAGEGDLGLSAGDSAALAPRSISAQLKSLNLNLLNCQEVPLPAEAEPAPVSTSPR
jgi:hypothetical protein